MIETDLLRRCCANPDEHLAKPDYWQYSAYLMGYNASADLQAEKMDRSDFDAIVKHDYNINDPWPFNLSTMSS